MEGLCLGPWDKASAFEMLDGGMWMLVVGGLQGRQRPGWGQVGPLITMLGAR